MSKICTSIEQSQKLIELGIDVKTADMYYNNGFTIDENDIHVRHEDDGYAPGHDIPCWSAGALLELMPEKILEHYLVLEKSGGAYQIYYAETKYAYQLAEFEGNNLIDVVYKMVIWLLENDYIEKGE